MDKLNQLIDETWIFHQKLKKDKETKDILVPDSMPLLWLGNFEDYKKSNLKVVTLSKNPSYAEFGENNRFEKMDYLSQLTSLTDKDRDIYINQLNDYFIYHPSKWFNPLSKIIRFFDADYTGKSNSAIHTDFFTPIPTHPVWPGLKDKQKHFPMQYPRLLGILSPDIIVTSLSMKNVKILLENIGEQYTEIFSKEEPNKSAKYIKAYRIDGKLTVINGRNFQGTYFGGMRLSHYSNK